MSENREREANEHLVADVSRITKREGGNVCGSFSNKKGWLLLLV